MAPDTKNLDSLVCSPPDRGGAGHLAPVVAAVILVALTANGCSGLQFPNTAFSKPSSPTYQNLQAGLQPQPATSEEEYHRIRQAKSQNAVVLQVVGDSNPSRVLPLPSDGRSVYVSSLLEQTGVREKIGRVQATLYRHSDDSISGIPMVVSMTKGGESVRPESDYALQPGDRLRVEEAPSELLQGMLSTLIGL